MNKKMLATIATVTALVASKVIYPDTAIVTRSDENGGPVVVSTSTGNLFQFDNETEDTYYLGDMVSLLMFNPGTPETVRDDMILYASPAGNLKYFVEIANQK